MLCCVVCVCFFFCVGRCLFWGRGLVFSAFTAVEGTAGRGRRWSTFCCPPSRVIGRMDGRKWHTRETASADLSIFVLEIAPISVLQTQTCRTPFPPSVLLAWLLRLSMARSSDGGELLSMVPPTIEALMDILEGSKDLTELLDNDVVQDVVDQTRGLVEQVIKKVWCVLGGFFGFLAGLVWFGFVWFGLVEERLFAIVYGVSISCSASAAVLASPLVRRSGAIITRGGWMKT